MTNTITSTKNLYKMAYRAARINARLTGRVCVGDDVFAFTRACNTLRLMANSQPAIYRAAMDSENNRWSKERNVSVHPGYYATMMQLAEDNRSPEDIWG